MPIHVADLSAFPKTSVGFRAATATSLRSWPAALKEFLKEFARLRGGDVSAEEVGKSAQLRRAEAIESLGTLGGLLGQASTYATSGQTLARLGEELAALSALDAGKVNANAKIALASDQGVMVLVGDRATIEKALADAGLPKGEVVKP